MTQNGDTALSYAPFNVRWNFPMTVILVIFNQLPLINYQYEEQANDANDAIPTN